MANKCVHKGCGRNFSDPEEECVYHPGPPIFHEGQKGMLSAMVTSDLYYDLPLTYHGPTGWKCCKARVLTFDEFLSIPPCTTGKHSTVDDTPAPDANPRQNQPAEEPVPPPKPIFTTNGIAQAPSETPRLPQASQPPAPSPAPPESDSDDPDLEIPAGTTCRRRGCNASYNPDTPRIDEQCVHHPGQALFHEGSKGWTCCKRRVLEFDEFMKIEGCKTKTRHRFGGGRDGKNKGSGEEVVESVRHDFYQTGSSVMASLYLKKIDKEKAKVEFEGQSVRLDLPTTERKRYKEVVPLFGPIEVEKSSFKIMGTKLELTLAKADGSSWPVLRSDERATGEIIQVGKPGRA